jgi:hypothetical protein
LFAEDRNTNAADLYLQASALLKNSHLPPIRKRSDLLSIKINIGQLWRKIIKEDIPQEDIPLKLLASFNELHKTLTIVQQANEIDNCVWDPTDRILQNMLKGYDMQGMHGSLDFLDEVTFLATVWQLRMYELLKKGKYNQAIDCWYGIVVLSRRITHSRWIVCHMVGIEKEIETTNVILRFVDLLNKSSVQKLLSSIKKLPKRMDVCDCMKHDIDFIYKRFLVHRLYNRLESAKYNSEIFVSEDIDTLLIPIKIYGEQYYCRDWLWAVCCLISVNDNEVSTYLVEYTELTKLPLSEFENEIKRYNNRVQNIRNVYLRAVIRSMLPSYLGKSYYEVEVTKVEQKLAKELSIARDKI